MSQQYYYSTLTGQQLDTALLQVSQVSASVEAAARSAEAAAESARQAQDVAAGNLPVGGETLGGVKNGGNVLINADGTMDAPTGGGSATMQPLTFTGAVEATYDGSEAVEVEIPQGGGGSEWKTLLNVTTTEEVSSITIDTDENGQTFDVKEVIIACRITANESATAGPFCRVHFYDANSTGHIVIQPQNGLVPASGSADYRVRVSYIDSIKHWWREPMLRSTTKNVNGSIYTIYTVLQKTDEELASQAVGSCVKIKFDARANMGVGSIIRIFGR